MELTVDQWKQRFIGALAILSGDEELAEAEAESFEDINPEADDPIESARETWAELQDKAAA